MRNLFKRAFAAVLTLCMLLAVLPAVSAAEGDPIVYSFKNKADSTTLALETDFAADANWYLLASSLVGSSSMKYNGGALYLSTKYNGFWWAIMIKVEEAGYYNLTSTLRGCDQATNYAFPETEIWLMDDAYADDVKALYNNNKTNEAAFDSIPKIAGIGGAVDATLNHGTSNFANTYAYLGNAYLEAGNYIIGVNPKGDAAETVNKRHYVYDFTLTPGQTGDAFVEQVSSAAYKNSAPITSQVTNVYQLAADLNAPDATLALGAQDLALNGHTLTVGSVTSPFVEGSATQLDAGVVSGISGDGTLVTGGTDPILPMGGQGSIPIKTAENTYQFATPEVVSGRVFTNADLTSDKFLQDAANFGFAFQINMDSGAMAAVAGGDTGVKVSMEWTLGTTKGKTVEFTNDDVVAWGAGTGGRDTFYMELANVGDLLSTYGAITCTPVVSWNSVSIKGEPIVLAGEKQDWDDDGELKILWVGNSYGKDTTEYAPQVFENLGVEKLTIGRLYRAGCSLTQHIDYFTREAKVYEFTTSTNVRTKETINLTGKWDYVDDSRQDYTNEVNGYNGLAALSYENWDYIVFQQVSSGSDDASTYAKLGELLDIVETKAPRARYVWSMTWAYSQAMLDEGAIDDNLPVEDAEQQIDMYNGIVAAVRDHMDARIEFVLPVGTAVQNARTSFIGDNLHRDTTASHLTYTAGRYTAAVTFVYKMMQQMQLSPDLDKLTWKPATVPADEARVAIESATNAVATPYAVTNSAITTADTIVASGTQLELVLTPNALWSSSGNPSYRLTLDKEVYAADGSSPAVPTTTNATAVNTSGYCEDFASTHTFTKEDLPVGTVIEIAEGYGYRVVGWVGDATFNSGPDFNVTNSKIIIDDKWWGDYEKVGFSIYTHSCDFDCDKGGNGTNTLGCSGNEDWNSEWANPMTITVPAN